MHAPKIKYILKLCMFVRFSNQWYRISGANTARWHFGCVCVAPMPRARARSEGRIHIYAIAAENSTENGGKCYI